MKLYTVVARSRASAVFYPGNAFEVLCSDAGGRQIKLVFRTNYAAGYEVPVPTDFYVEAFGEASDPSDAASRFQQIALEIENLIAFAVNADLGHLEVELVFESSPDSTEHPFVQMFVPNWPVQHVSARPIPPDTIRDFFQCVNAHPEVGTIQTAIVQYCEALRRWNAGHGIICLAHIYMGAEAITKSFLRRELDATQLSREQLTNKWNIDIKQLDSEVRKRLIFKGDEACFRQARKISDQFEHGFGDFSTMRAPAADIVVKVARYLRIAILDIAHVTPELYQTLLGEPYDQPRGPLGLVKKISGTLVGPLDKLAKQGNPYPILLWKSRLKRVSFAENGRYAFEPDDSFTPEMGDGTQLRLGTIEIWDNQLTDPQAAAIANAKVPRSPVSARFSPAPKPNRWDRFRLFFMKLLLRIGLSAHDQH